MKTIKELEILSSKDDREEFGYRDALKDVLGLIDEVVMVPSIKEELKARITGWNLSVNIVIRSFIVL